MFYGALVLGLGFYSSFVVTGSRMDTFKRNYAQIEKKYGEEHEKALGDGAKINPLGYPDMGNNLYADLLPYKDWVMFNNM